MEKNNESEQRKFPRTQDTFVVIYKFPLPVPVTMNTETEEYPAVAMDISEGGVGLDVDRRLPSDTPVHLRFEIINYHATDDKYRRRLFKLVGQTRHCAVRERDLYRVGVRFSQLTPEELDFLAVYIKNNSGSGTHGGGASAR